MYLLIGINVTFLGLSPENVKFRPFSELIFLMETVIRGRRQLIQTPPPHHPHSTESVLTFHLWPQVFLFYWGDDTFSGRSK